MKFLLLMSMTHLKQTTLLEKNITKNLNMTLMEVILKVFYVTKQEIFGFVMKIDLRSTLSMKVEL